MVDDDSRLNRDDAEVSDTSASSLKVSEGTYTSIAEDHIKGTPLVMPSMLAAVPSPDVSNVELNIPNPEGLSEAQN